MENTEKKLPPVKNSHIFDNLTLSYKLIPKDEVRDKIEVEIGDSKDLSQFYPQAKIMRWDNEVNLSVRLIVNNEDNEIIIQDDEKIVWEKGKISVNFYNITSGSESNIEGGYEFEVILKEKPKSNILIFSINTKELDFFYQPFPTEEEKLAQSFYRPADVCGSYAVYHKTKNGNYLSGKNYKAGKAFHIYRPKIYDANKNWVWGKLSIDENYGLMYLTIPQEFVDNSVYPILIDPTFGYDSTSATTEGTTSGELRGYRFTCPEEGTITSITQYCETTKPGTKRKFALYGQTDDTLVANTTSEEITSTVDGSVVGWVTGNITSGATLANQDYYIAILHNLSPSKNAGNFRYDTGTSNYGFYISTPYTSGFPSTLSSHSVNKKYCVYATYSTGGDFSINKSDGVSLSEGISLTISDSQVSRSESIGITENILVSRQEATSLTVTISDSVSVTENKAATTSSPQVTISDSIEVIDIAAILMTRATSINDSVGISENISIQISDLQINVSDLVEVAESISVTNQEITALTVTVLDNISLSDEIFGNILLSQVVSDSITLEENLQADLFQTLYINVSDSIGISELNTDLIDINLSTSDSIIINELSPTFFELEVVASDSVEIAESIFTEPPAFEIYVSDSILIEECWHTDSDWLEDAPSDSDWLEEAPSDSSWNEEWCPR